MNVPFGYQNLTPYSDHLTKAGCSMQLGPLILCVLQFELSSHQSFLIILCFFRAVFTTELIFLQRPMCTEYGQPFLNLALQPGHVLSFPIEIELIKENETCQ